MRKFDITFNFNLTGKNSFGEKETLGASRTRTYTAKDEATAVAEMKFDCRKNGITLTGHSVCERG